MCPAPSFKSFEASNGMFLTGNVIGSCENFRLVTNVVAGQSRGRGLVCPAPRFHILNLAMEILQLEM
jgi:hypothetical protein